MGGALSMFEKAKDAFSVPGIGLSRTSRALGRDFLNKTSGDFNKLFSTGIDTQYSIDAMKTQIMAKRASLSTSQLASYLQENPDDIEGRVVDKEA
jgi:hypothetical protein